MLLSKQGIGILLFGCLQWVPLTAASQVPGGELACVQSKNSIVELQIAEFDFQDARPNKKTVKVNNAGEFIDALAGTAHTIVLAYKGKFDFSYVLCDGIQCPDHIQKFGTDKNLSAFINRDVRIIGERGPLCQRPTVHLTKKDSAAMWVVRQGEIEIRGLHFLGAADTQKNRSSSQGGYSAILAIRAVDTPGKLLIIDNEFSEWTGAGVDVSSPHDVRTVAEYKSDWPRPTEADGAKLRIERNYFHHNAREGTGYGVGVSGGTHVWILGNLFNFNRHAVASSGYAYAGYTAKFNYLMEGGYRDGVGVIDPGFYNQHFDVHGTSLSDPGYGGSAGDIFSIANNTVRGAQTYYATKTRPAFLLRGQVNTLARFVDNVLVHNSESDAIRLKGLSISSSTSPSVQATAAAYKLLLAGNKYGVDNAKRIAIGDFDGDGQSDFLLTNGTAWWISRNTERPWEFLHASSKLSSNLLIADVDGDGIDDILFKEGPTIAYLPKGSGSPKVFAVLPPYLVDAPIQTLAINGRNVALLAKNGAVFQKKGDQWMSLSSKAVDVAIDADGSIWTTNPSGNIFKYAQGRWIKMPGSDGARISAGAGQVWLVNTVGKIYKWDGFKWRQTPGSSAKDIFVSPKGDVFLTNTVGLVYKWNGSSWTVLPIAS